MADWTAREPKKIPSLATTDDERLQHAVSDRIAIEAVTPEIDGGRFAVKRVVGDVLTIEADVFCDGHDKIDAVLRTRFEAEQDWRELPMQFLGNDRWTVDLPLPWNGRYLYTIVAWRDLYAELIRFGAERDLPRRYRNN